MQTKFRQISSEKCIGQGIGPFSCSYTLILLLCHLTLRKIVTFYWGFYWHLNITYENTSRFPFTTLNKAQLTLNPSHPPYFPNYWCQEINVVWGLLPTFQTFISYHISTMLEIVDHLVGHFMCRPKSVSFRHRNALDKAFNQWAITIPISYYCLI